MKPRLLQIKHHWATAAGYEEYRQWQKRQQRVWNKIASQFADPDSTDARLAHYKACIRQDVPLDEFQIEDYQKLTSK